MATRRKLDDALEYGRSMQPIHELQSAGAGAAPEDIVAILDVSEVDADAQPKKITLQDLVTAAGGGSATPAGNAGEIQINDGADPPNLGAVTDFKWDSVNGALDVPGDINLDDGGTYATTLQVITPTANRTISFPDATGTLALVAGSSGQLIYNNAGVNAGTPTLTYDGSILTSSGRFINSYNATASSPAKAFTGTWFTGGTATTTKPQVLIEPAGTTSTAWSTSGTGLGINAASGFAGNLLDLQNNGTSQTQIQSNGALLFGSNGSPSTPKLRTAAGGNTGYGIYYGATQNGFYYSWNGAPTAGFSIDGVQVVSNKQIAWTNSTGAPDATRDTGLKRDQAGVVALTDGSTGVGYLKTTPVAVSALPAAATVGAGTRGFVSDSTVAASGNFGATVTGGGSNNVPVFSDGTNWLIG